MTPTSFFWSSYQNINQYLFNTKPLKKNPGPGGEPWKDAKLEKPREKPRACVALEWLSLYQTAIQGLKEEKGLREISWKENCSVIQVFQAKSGEGDRVESRDVGDGGQSSVQTACVDSSVPHRVPLGSRSPQSLGRGTAISYPLAPSAHTCSVANVWVSLVVPPQSTGLRGLHIAFLLYFRQRVITFAYVISHLHSILSPSIADTRNKPITLNFF